MISRSIDSVNVNAEPNGCYQGYNASYNASMCFRITEFSTTFSNADAHCKTRSRYLGALAEVRDSGARDFLLPIIGSGMSATSLSVTFLHGRLFSHTRDRIYTFPHFRPLPLISFSHEFLYSFLPQLKRNKTKILVFKNRGSSRIARP